MLITRKKKVPFYWVFYAQLAFVISIWGGFVFGAPFLLAMKKFIDNPAAITFLLAADGVVNSVGGSFVNWLSDRIWTRYGRRKVLIAASDIGKVCVMPLMAFAPNMWTLIILKWIYGFLGEFGSPNQALTMEVIPPAQRGLGAGFFQMQLNLANIVFWGVIIGRFDDIYFMGPLNGLMSMSGEQLMFLSASLLFMAVGVYTFFGFKEIEPPHHKSIRDERKPGEIFVWVFFRSFFKDIFAKDLLPLYLLLFAGAMAGIGLGILGPLLYIDQWGYSTQEMGTNVAIGAVINIFIALLAGYFADATSKMRVYIIAQAVGLCMKIIWMGYVYFKPDHRPELWELVVFGEVTAVFDMIAGVVSFPLILEYVERNRLGTAGAGMGIFRQILGSGLAIFVGAWVVWWSVLFLPQAGDYLEIVFKQAKSKAALTSELTAAGMDLKGIYLEPKHRPGITVAESRRWCIRRHTEHSSQLQDEKKNIENEIAKWNASMQSPLLSGKKRADLTARLAAARDRIREVKKELNESAHQFARQVTKMVSRDLPADGSQIEAASAEGPKLTLDLAVVEPVSPGLAAKLTDVLGSAEYVMEPTPANPNEFQSKIQVKPLEAPANGLHVEAALDSRFTALCRGMFDAGVKFEDAFSRASMVMEILRDSFGCEETCFTISSVALHPAGTDASRLSFLLISPGHTPRPQPQELVSPFKQASEIASAAAVEETGGLRLNLEFKTPFTHATATQENEEARQIASLLGRNDPYARHSLAHLYQQVAEAAAAKPIYLTMVQPIIKQTFADRVYDYFFSVYFLMIAGNLFCLGVIALIMRLEAKGVVHRLGVEEDANR